jgi:hypothetical protein
MQGQAWTVGYYGGWLKKPIWKAPICTWSMICGRAAEPLCRTIYAYCTACTAGVGGSAASLAMPAVYPPFSTICHSRLVGEQLVVTVDMAQQIHMEHV